MFCTVLEFRKKKRTFEKIKESNVDFFLLNMLDSTTENTGPSLSQSDGYATNWAQNVGSLAQITARQEKSSDLNATQAWQQTEAGKTGCSLTFSPCLFNRAETI
jgi:hypothetical protein